MGLCKASLALSMLLLVKVGGEEAVVQQLHSMAQRTLVRSSRLPCRHV